MTTDHPNVAIQVNNLGAVAHNQGDLLAARASLERALRIKAQQLGADHPSTRLTRDKLAGVLAAIEDQTRNEGQAEGAG
jgi:Tfp pilus assembly protein PilF